MSRSLDADALGALATLTRLDMPVDRAAAALASYNDALVTLAALDEVRLGETPPAAAFAASWE
jgi:hypothetical protein